ncbi:MarR family winged helix-turn-helix transcriptional regulator [Marinomonas sp. TW1]|uniref:MarR family winged helix-turn-helix transcriptional regulator n=1 Tax=Marinomonas sp. TW1 TaxID=1561203 RepID=UPI0007AFDB95|nr:MarR family transcriptional regulator [Marinomonas sp. TW1]KZN14363.1 MarR family transcriptional regulator [Marinomonas sp. TW1]
MQSKNINFLITDVLRLMRREYRKSDLAMTLMQARTLLSVSRNEGVKQVTLAELLDIQPITLARLIDQLVSDGLVERRADPKDRRANALFLTEKATPWLLEIDKEINRVREKALQGLTPEQIDVAMDVLTKMHENLTDD